MSTNKYYKKYASGGSFKNRKLDDGLRAMQEQTKSKIGGIETVRKQLVQDRNEHMKALDRKNQKEAQNRADVYKLEVEMSHKLRSNALAQNHKTQVESFQTEANEYRNRAKMWAELTPTLAKTFGDLADDVETHINTKNAIKEFNRMETEGVFQKLNVVQNKIISDSDTIGIANDRYTNVSEYAKTGDVDAKLRFDYVSKINATRNPVLQEMIYNKYRDNFAGIDDEWKNFLLTNNITVTKENALALYQYRGMEALREYGIDPNSKLGVKMMRLFTSRGANYETQIGLKDDKRFYSEQASKASEIIESLSKPLNPSDYPTTAQYEFAVKTQDEQRNAAWIDLASSLQAIPIGSEDNLSRPISPNLKENLLDWAKDNMKDYQFSDDFMRDMFGKTKRNPNGYLIPGADRNSKNPKDRILGKFPNLEKEMLELFAEEYDKSEADRARLTDNRHRIDANILQDKLNSGYYDKPENRDEFWVDWENSNGNPHARKVFAGSLGYKSEYINQNTINSTIVQNYKAGNLAEVYTAWASLESDSKQEIGFIVKDLQELATLYGVEVKQLDKEIRSYTSGQIDMVINRESLDKTAHTTAKQKDLEALGFLLEHFKNNNVGTAFDRWEQAKAALDAKLGIVNGTAVSFQNGLRGSGEFLQKQGKSGRTNQTIFVKDAGENFGNITSLEIEMDLEGVRNPQKRLQKLARLVDDDLKSPERTGAQPSISNEDLAELLSTGETDNRLLNHLMKEENLGKVTKADFINSIKNKVDNTLIFQWGGEDWCNYILGPASGGLTNNQKAIGVCARAIEKQFDVKAYEFLINPSLKDRFKR